MSVEFASPERGRVLLVDDAPEILLIVNDILQDHYEILLAPDGPTALHLAAAGNLQLVLLDLVMPGMDGHEVCRRLKADPATAGIPVIFLTSKDQPEHEAQAFEEGAVDYLTKPIVPSVLRARVDTHVRLSQASALLQDQVLHLEGLVAERSAEIATLRDATVLALASLAEFRAPETGNHLRRTAHYVAALANQARQNPKFSAALTPDVIHQLFQSAPLHDLGKVAIPDHILFKPGKLTPQEFEVVKQHAAIGRDAVATVRREIGGDNAFLRYAAEIAYGHHEWYDGSGYPRGLRGDAIPLSARLMAIADVYDALISWRVYKPAVSHDVALAHLVSARGTQFDPDLIDALLPIAWRFQDIAARFPDEADAPSRRVAASVSG
jgi:putative two-component system response regulator